MTGMSATYDELLEATISHLENLKARGTRHLAVAPETLRALALPIKPGAMVASPMAAPVPRPATPTFRPAVETTTPIIAKTPAVPKVPETSLIAPATEISAAPVLHPAEKAAAFASLRERAMVCVKCPNLAASRRNVVFGVGNIDADVMFVGEAPGRG